MPTKNIVGGNFQDAAGTAIVGGTLVLQLSQDAVVASTGTVVRNRQIALTLDSNGSIASTPIWFNDELSPTGTYYQVWVSDASGSPIYSGQSWVFAGATGLNLNTMVPASGAVSYPTPIVATPSGNQSITTNSLLPASGNTTQSLGSPSASWNAILRDATISKLNGARIVDGTRYANVQAALNDLPTNGGIVICPPGYRETITSKITLGSASSTVLLMMQTDVILTCNITNGTDALFSIHNGGGIIGTQLGNLTSRAGGSVISLASTASVTNVIETADNPQGNIQLENFTIDNVNAGAVSGSFIELLNLNDICTIRNIHGAYFPNKGIHVSATTGGTKTVGPLNIENCYFDGVNKTTARPLVIESDGSGSVNGVHVIGGYWINPGTSKGCIELNGNGGTTGTLRDVLISEVYTQSGSNTGITGIKIVDAAGVIVLGGEFQTTAGATTGQTGISIASSGSNCTHSITVHNFRLNAPGSNTGLNNTITSETLLGSTGNIPFYIYQNTAGTQAAADSVIEGNLQTTGLLTAKSGVNFGSGTTLTLYQEGTWTPTASGITTTGTVTYGGSYTRIGRLVVFAIIITMAAASTSAAAAGASITLPFSAARDSGAVISNNNNNYTGSGQVHFGNVNVTAWTTTTGAASSLIYVTGVYEVS